MDDNTPNSIAPTQVENPAGAAGAPTSLRQPAKVWRLYGVAAVFVCSVLYGYFLSTNEIGDVWYLFGQNLVYALVLWLVLRPKKNEAPGKVSSGAYFLLILVSLMCGSMVSYWRHKAAAMQALGEIQKALVATRQQASDSQDQKPIVSTPIDTTPKSSGDAGEIESFVKASLNSVTKIQNDYQVGLQAIGWGNILDGARIEKDANLLESKTMIRQAKDLVATYKEKMYAQMDHSRLQIDSLNVSEETKESAKAGFDKSLAASKIKFNAFIELEGKTIDGFGAIINLLDSHDGRWTIKNGKIIFAFQHDLDLFNSHLTEIKYLTDQEEILQKKARDEQDEQFKSLKTD